MKLVDVAPHWTVHMDSVPVVDPVLLEMAAQLVAQMDSSPDVAFMVNPGLTPLDQMDQLLHEVERWQEFHRRACTKDVYDCTCEKAIDYLFRAGVVADLVQGSMPWANLTDAEIARQVASATSAIFRTLKSRSCRTLGELGDLEEPGQSPRRLLITSLTTAPGAPPAEVDPHYTEGLRAA